MACIRTRRSFDASRFFVQERVHSLLVLEERTSIFRQGHRIDCLLHASLIIQKTSGVPVVIYRVDSATLCADQPLQHQRKISMKT